MMETKLTELNGKMKALNLTIGKSNDAVTARNKDALSRHVASISKKVEAMYILKEDIVELKFVADEAEQDVQLWAEGIDAKLSEAETKATAIQELLTEMDQEEKGIQRKEAEQAQSEAHQEEVEKQLALVRAKYELEHAHQEEERKRELQHQEEILNQKLKYQKSLEAEQDTKQKKVTSTKLPKLPITMFSGKFCDWLPFWNAFETEIDSSDLSPVAKFGYLREWLEPKVKGDIEGLPFTTEGYQRAKNILKSEYGKTSEIINAHVQNIMGLPDISGAQPAKVHEFYKTLMYNVQSLETLGKLERVNGMTRSVIEKLKGIKADLVRGEDGWQDWDFSRLVVALKKWKDIHPVEDSESQRKPPPQKRFDKKSGFYHTKDGERRNRACVYCDQAEHSSKDCSRVTTVDERKRLLAQRKLCFNCTGAKHRASECKSNLTCKKCNLKHHTSICNKQNLLTAAGNSEGSLVYPVVVVEVEGLKCRALLDTGAGGSYASAALINRLPKRNSHKEVRHVEMMLGSVTKEMEMSTIKVEALDGKFNINVNVTKVDKGELLMLDNPNYEQLLNTYKHLEGVEMLDHDRKPKLPIHLILGASDYMRIKTGERPRIGKIGEPVAEKTRFGWTIIAQGEEIDYTAMLLTQASQSDYEELCRLDVLGLADACERDQREVYSEFREQLVRSDDGWYETGLPWKGDHPPLPNNRNGSLRRLANLQRKLRQTAMTESYAEIIEKQKADGIVETASDQPCGVEFYIPHKPVVREAAESTKLRIVYDASARAYPEAPSLNECLNAGPPLQNRLWNVLVRLRFHPVAVTGDLKQAFLQVRIKEAERDALRFHWRADEHSEIETLRFTRALFGLAPSPFLLGGVIEQHLESWESRAPNVVAEIRKSMYVDDLISGKTTVKKAQLFKQEATEIFHDATFTLHKWHSNAAELEEATTNVTGEQTFAKQQLGTASGGDSSLLGLTWNKCDDVISVVVPEEKATPTKRGVLRKLAKIYDPLGFASPQILQGKFIYREVCQTKLAWDVPLQSELMKRWERWEQLLPNKVITTRTLAKYREDIESIELHTFGDASIKGVSSVVYAVVRQKSGVTKGLVAAKARLAKQGLTIPRLELVSAHMAANLISNVQVALEGFPVTILHGWLDSTVALHWIRGAGEHKQFVANRVRKIQAHSQIQWRHVPTKENPADLGSRGGEVKDDRLWWDGPEWLSEQENWPPNITTKATKESDAEAKVVRELFASTVEVAVDSFDYLLAKFNLSKTLRVCAWVSRFLTNSRSPNQHVRGPLTTEEIEQQRLFWIKRTQAQCDCEEDRLRLNLQKNAQDVLECRGRIQGQYPIYLHDNHSFTAKLVEDTHQRTLHGGVGLTMARVRECYWVPRLRQLSRKVIKRCFGCRRFQARAVAQPPPGLLPLDRTEGSRPFEVVGVDFAGPIRYVTKGKKEAKSYITLYACSLTRAVYLELLHSLHTEEFLQSLKRFIARRGRPSKVYSDNGKTFVAAAKWLKTTQTDEKFNDFLAASQIRWQFNLSRAPWWGGQFERLIGLVKRALHKTIGNGCLTWSELEEILLDIEVTLNCRPLDYLEDDVQMPTLTPNAMLFVGSTFVPELEAHHVQEVDLRKRARYLLKCKDAMWRRWSSEYLRGLRERHNQKHERKSFTVAKGDVVIIKSDERNRGKWPLGVVEELYEGRDGVVRAVKLRAGKTFLERAINHLYPLELSCDRTDSKLSDHLNPEAPTFRPTRDAAVAACQRIQDIAEGEL